MKAVLVVMIVALACVAAHPTFHQFKNMFGKTYEPVEEKFRMAVYHKNLKTIDRLNAANTGAQYDVNELSDLTHEEFKQKYLGSKPTEETGPAYTPEEILSADGVAVDWRTKGAVTAVKNQEQCGSCWAFSATEEIESAWFLSGKKLVSLSPQQIVSCDTVDQGCNGGWTYDAYKYVMGAGGIEYSKDYPYTSGSGDSGTCNFNSVDIAAKIKGWKFAGQNNETVMASVIQSTAPLSICVEADTWQFYSGGILSSNCGTAIDHCVQLVGMNTQGSTPYWMVRNSWGATWGIDGYIHIEMYKNLCGINMYPTLVEV